VAGYPFVPVDVLGAPDEDFLVAFGLGYRHGEHPGAFCALHRGLVVFVGDLVLDRQVPQVARNGRAHGLDFVRARRLCFGRQRQELIEGRGRIEPPKHRRGLHEPPAGSVSGLGSKAHLEDWEALVPALASQGKNVEGGKQGVGKLDGDLDDLCRALRAELKGALGAKSIRGDPLDEYLANHGRNPYSNVL